jgi:ribonuclease R
VLSAAKGKPEEYAVNLAVLKSLTRAEYSPKPDGHFALASDCYSHFTSPIRRYADLTVHRLLDAYFEAAGSNAPGHMAKPKGRVRVNADEQPSFDDLVTLGKHISFTERRAEGAERELRKLKILYLLESRLGEEFDGVVTGIANFGLYVQLNQYLVDGVCRFDDLMDDWWDIDERSGVVRGQRSGRRIGIGDAVKVKIARVVSARRELDLALVKVVGRIGRFAPTSGAAGGADQKGNKPQGRRALRDKTRQGKPIPKGKPFPGKPFSQGKPFAGKTAAGKPWPGLEGNQAVGNAEGGGDGGEGVGFQLRRADGTTRRAKKSKLRDKKKINKPGRRQVIKKKKKK